MAHKFRLLETGFHPAVFNMGLDEAILDSVSQGNCLPTLRFYGWIPPAVSLGYFQGLQEEIDIEACKALGIDVVRRITGGGAVFHHHEVTYSIVIPLGHSLARSGIIDSYRILLAGIVEGLAELGIQSEFAPINDIVSAGKKISGNAQTRKKGCILQHGTIIVLSLIHISEPTRLLSISYAVFCLKQKTHSSPCIPPLLRLSQLA